MCKSIMPVAGYARLVIHDGFTALDESVKRSISHIGTPYDSNDVRHEGLKGRKVNPKDQ